MPAEPSGDLVGSRRQPRPPRRRQWVPRFPGRRPGRLVVVTGVVLLVALGLSARSVLSPADTDHHGGVLTMVGSVLAITYEDSAAVTDVTVHWSEEFSPAGGDHQRRSGRLPPGGRSPGGGTRARSGHRPAGTDRWRSHLHPPPPQGGSLLHRDPGTGRRHPAGHRAHRRAPRHHPALLHQGDRRRAGLRGRHEGGQRPVHATAGLRPAGGDHRERPDRRDHIPPHPTDAGVLLPAGPAERLPRCRRTPHWTCHRERRCRPPGRTCSAPSHGCRSRRTGTPGSSWSATRTSTCGRPPRSPLATRTGSCWRPATPRKRSWRGCTTAAPTWPGPACRRPTRADSGPGTARQMLHTTAGLNTHYVFLNATRPPFNNRDARRAVAYALDRGALTGDRNLFSGPVTCQLLPPGFGGLPPLLPVHPRRWRRRAVDRARPRTARGARQEVRNPGARVVVLVDNADSGPADGRPAGRGPARPPRVPRVATCGVARFLASSSPGTGTPTGTPGSGLGRRLPDRLDSSWSTSRSCDPDLRRRTRITCRDTATRT